MFMYKCKRVAGYTGNGFPFPLDKAMQSSYTAFFESFHFTLISSHDKENWSRPVNGLQIDAEKNITYDSIMNVTRSGISFIIKTNERELHCHQLRR